MVTVLIPYKVTAYVAGFTFSSAIALEVSVQVTVPTIGSFLSSLSKTTDRLVVFYDAFLAVLGTTPMKTGGSKTITTKKTTF